MQFEEESSLSYSIKIVSHQKAFDLLYAQRQKESPPIRFPLEEIDRFSWDRGPHSNAIYSYFYRRFTVFLLGLLQVEGSQRILNIGCGAGFDEKNLVNLYSDLDLWSIDVSSEMILKAIKNQCPSKLSLSLAEALPFADGSFDRIIAREVIEHVHSPELMVKEIARCLKPGGLAVVTTEFESSAAFSHFYSKFFYQRWARLLGQRMPETPYRNRPPSLKEMREWAESSGLILEKAIWDGALYHFCTSLLFQKIFKAEAVALARFFSPLENSGSVEKFFCDQVKLALRKPFSDKEWVAHLNAMDYCCPKCHGKFEDAAEGRQCSLCRKIYPYTNAGVLNFVLYDLPSPQVAGHGEKRGEWGASEEMIFEKIKKFIFRSCHFLAFWTYLCLVLFLATLSVFWRILFKKSELKNALNLDDKLAGYLKIGERRSSQKTTVTSFFS